MSVSENMIFLKDVSEFDYGTAEFIALEVAAGAAVSGLHEAYPDRVPSTIVVNRWRKQIPAFDLLMGEAEEAKAELLADQVVSIADDQDLLAAQANNAIKARQWLAGKLHERFGTSPVSKGGAGAVNLSVRLTDEQLMQIASGGVIDGESKRLPESAGDPDPCDF